MRTGHEKPAAARYSKHQWHTLMLWRDLGKAGLLTYTSDATLNAFIKGQCGVADLRFLATGQASLVIEALKSWLRRVRAK